MGRLLPLRSAVSTSQVMFSVEGKRRSKWPLLPSGAHLPGQRCDRSATGQHRSRAGAGTKEGPPGSTGDARDPDGDGSWTRWWRRSTRVSGTGAGGWQTGPRARIAPCSPQGRACEIALAASLLSPRQPAPLLLLHGRTQTGGSCGCSLAGQPSSQGLL